MKSAVAEPLTRRNSWKYSSNFVTLYLVLLLPGFFTDNWTKKWLMIIKVGKGN